MSLKLKIAVGQMRSSSNVKNNARVVCKLIDRAAELKARVLFLPEASDYISRDPSHSVRLAQETTKNFVNVIQEKLKSIYQSSDQHALSVAVGVHEPTQGVNNNCKVQNNQLWINELGVVKHRYQKIHLFDINIPDGPVLQESKSVEAGKEILSPFAVSEDHHDFTVGFAICYDIRFPELAAQLRQMGATILTYPSAFITKTGEAHWLELGRARAIDTQCFVVMAAQCGEHDTKADLSQVDQKSTNGSKRVSYGQSVIIGPWGNVLTKGPTFLEACVQNSIDAEGDYYELFDAELELDELQRVRKNLPVFSHKRPDLYST